MESSSSRLSNREFSVGIEDLLTHCSSECYNEQPVHVLCIIFLYMENNVQLSGIWSNSLVPSLVANLTPIFATCWITIGNHQEKQQNRIELFRTKQTIWPVGRWNQLTSSERFDQPLEQARLSGAWSESLRSRRTFGYESRISYMKRVWVEGLAHESLRRTVWIGKWKLIRGAFMLDCASNRNQVDKFPNWAQTGRMLGGARRCSVDDNNFEDDRSGCLGRERDERQTLGGPKARTYKGARWVSIEIQNRIHWVSLESTGFP